MQSYWVIIGIGNEYRSDDGVGLMVARKIEEKKLPSLTVKQKSGEGAAIIEAWQGFENVIIVDAISSGNKPGAIFKFDVNNKVLPAKFFHYSSHAFSLGDAIELARTLNKLPSKLIVYGIEGKNFSAGKEISLPLKEAANQVIKQIITDFKHSKSVEENKGTTENHIYKDNNMNKNIIYQRSLH